MITDQFKEVPLLSDDALIQVVTTLRAYRKAEQAYFQARKDNANKSDLNNRLNDLKTLQARLDVYCREYEQAGVI